MTPAHAPRGLRPLDRGFFERPALGVARALLGCRIVRRTPGGEEVALVLETEAYGGPEDLASHARAGPTPRTRIMWGPPGRAYVYRIYGVHWMLNVVTGPHGVPGAVLVRAAWLLPGKGVAPSGTGSLVEGPALLCRRLGIDGTLNGTDLCSEGSLFLAPGRPVPDGAVLKGPRVGLGRVPEPWRNVPWRFRTARILDETIQLASCHPAGMFSP